LESNWRFNVWDQGLNGLPVVMLARYRPPLDVFWVFWSPPGNPLFPVGNIGVVETGAEAGMLEVDIDSFQTKPGGPHQGFPYGQNVDPDH
jgi:hypothetical protein